MSHSVSTNLASTMYLFHHDNVEIDINALKHSDPIFPIKWSSEKNYNSVKQKESWNIELYKSMMKTKYLSQTFAFSDSMKSTQTFTKENALDLPNGTMTVCNTQSAGKGRGSNKWVSPNGCLLYSFITALPDAKVKCLTTMQYVISIAVVDTILSLTNNKIQLQLKWPNDIYYNNLKIGGVLCESIYDMKKKRYIITSGIGLNVSNQQPTICINDIITNERNNEEKDGNDDHDDDIALVLSKEEILSEFVNTFEPMYECLIEDGFHKMKDKYLRYWIHSGQKIMVDQDAKGMKGNSECGKIEMFIMGLSDGGQLMGKNKNGNVFELHPDGNSFDFLQGLICRKPQNV